MENGECSASIADAIKSKLLAHQHFVETIKIIIFGTTIFEVYAIMDKNRSQTSNPHWNSFNNKSDSIHYMLHLWYI